MCQKFRPKGRGFKPPQKFLAKFLCIKWGLFKVLYTQKPRKLLIIRKFLIFCDPKNCFTIFQGFSLGDEGVRSFYALGFWYPQGQGWEALRFKPHHSWLGVGALPALGWRFNQYPAGILCRNPEILTSGRIGGPAGVHIGWWTGLYSTFLFWLRQLPPAPRCGRNPYSGGFSAQTSIYMLWIKK